MQLLYLFKGLELAPAALERIVALVPESAYDVKRDPARFTIREAAAHLADLGADQPGPASSRRQRTRMHCARLR